MFNGSRFFNLLKIWKFEDKKDYILILRAVMNHYFDSIAGYNNVNKFKVDGSFGSNDIAYVLDCIGYNNYSIDTCSEPGVTYVTLLNDL